MQFHITKQALVWGEKSFSQSMCIQYLSCQIQDSLTGSLHRGSVAKAIVLLCQVMNAQQDYISLIVLREVYGDLMRAEETIYGEIHGSHSKLEILVRDAYLALGMSVRAVKVFVGLTSCQAC